MVIWYSGIKLEVIRVIDFVRQPVMSDDGVDYLFTEVDISVVAVVSSDQIAAALGGRADDTIGMSYRRELTGDLNAGDPKKIARPPQVFHTAFSNPIITDDAIRHWLSVPRRQLIVADDNPKGRSFLLFSPQLGFVVDAHNGPIPQVFNIEQTHGDARMFVVSFRVKTYINECENNTGIAGAFLSNRFSQKHTVDQDGYTLIETEGDARFRTDYVYGNLNPDNLRPYLFLPIPNGFKREQIEVKGGSDASLLRYRFIDRQMPQQLVVGDEIGATRVEGTYTQAILTNEDVLGAKIRLGEKIADATLSALYSQQSVNPISFGSGATLGTVAAAAKIAFAGIEYVKDVMPKNVEQIQVTVWGGPTAKRRNLYRLAMAIVWGQIQRRDHLQELPPGGHLVLSYDLEKKNVTVECKIVTNWVNILTARLTSKRRHYEIFEGPKESVVGGEWAFTMIPGFVGMRAGGDLKNGFEGRTLITSDAAYKDGKGQTQVSRSPTPPGDHLSRGLATVAISPAARIGDQKNWNNRPDYLIYAALSQTCTASNFFTPVIRPAPSGFNPVPSPVASPDQVANMYSSGQPSLSPFSTPTQVVTQAPPPTETPPQHSTPTTPTLPQTGTLPEFTPIPPGNPAGIPIFDGGSGNQNYDPDSATGPTVP